MNVKNKNIKLLSKFMQAIHEYDVFLFLHSSAVPSPTFEFHHKLQLSAYTTLH
jgi:hypothetical protein